MTHDLTVNLKLLPPKPFTHCMPWRLRDPFRGPWIGALCCYCERDVAAPMTAQGKHVACIYCGLEKGELPEIEIEPDASTTGYY